MYVINCYYDHVYLIAKVDEDTFESIDPKLLIPNYGTDDEKYMCANEVERSWVETLIKTSPGNVDQDVLEDIVYGTTYYDYVKIIKTLGN